MKKNLRIGIIGCGVIAPSHIESYQLDPNVKVVWACDIIKSRADAVADKFGIPNRTASANDVFSDPSIDAVSICTPHYTHAALCEAAISAGKDVLCEKALSSDRAGLARMLKAAEKHPDAIFAGVFQHRYTPLFQCLKELIKKGAFGKVITAAMQHRCLRTDDYYNSGDWRGTWKMEGGGVLINQAIHYLDIFQWVMGGVKKVEAFYANQIHRKSIETEDTIVGALLFNNGAIGTIEASNATYLDWETTIEVTGTEGAVEIRDDKIRKAVFKNKDIAGQLEKAYEAGLNLSAGKIGKAYYGYGHPVQIMDFLKAVRTRKAPYVTVQDASSGVKLVLDLYKAARKNSPKGPGGHKKPFRP